MVKRRTRIQAPRAVVFEVISDLESYPEFVPATKEVVITKHEPLEARFVIQLVKEVRYRLRFQLFSPEELQWEMIEGEWMNKNSGYWKLDSLSETETEAEYGADVQFGWLVPSGVVDMLTEQQLPALLKAFKKRAEEKYHS